MSIPGQFIGGLLNYYTSGLGAEQARDQGELAQQQLAELGQTTVAGTQFQPYTVTSGLANVGTTAQGGFNLNLSPQQQAMQNAAFGQANQFFGQAGQGMTPAQQQAASGLFNQAQGAFGQAGQGMTSAERRAASALFNQAQGAFGQAGQGMTPAERRAASGLFSQAQGQFGQVGEGMTRAERDTQNRRFREAEELYGRARGDTGALAGEYYENIRAAQRPEEERQRMNLDQGLFSSGRGGISTAEFGGTAEEFAFEKARAEAGLQASATARQAALGEQAQALQSAQQLSSQAYAGERAAQTRDAQALALGSGLMSQSFSPEQQALAQQQGFANLGGALMSQSFSPEQQALAQQQGFANLGGALMGQSFIPQQQALAQQTGYGNLGSMMMGQGYMPQQQALDLFGASQIPAQLASRGQLSGQELSAQLGQAGIEALMQGEQVAGNLDTARLQALIPLLTGSGGGGGGANSTESLIDAFIGLFTGGDDDETSGNVATLPDDFDGSL